MSHEHQPVVPGLPPPQSAKEERFHRVAEAVVHCLLHGGPADLKYARIARRARVSRAWLYKYFGVDRNALLDFTARAYGEAFAELDEDRAPPDAAAWHALIAEATRQGLHDAEQAPWVPQLWFRYRDDHHALGVAIRTIEERHLQKFVADMPASLRPDPAPARHFASVFASARLGMYHRWTDDAYRERHDLEAVVHTLMGMLDRWTGR